MKKVRLEINEESFEEIREMLEKSGFNVTTEDDEDYILLQKDLHVSHLSVRNRVGVLYHRTLSVISASQTAAGIT